MTHEPHNGLPPHGEWTPVVRVYEHGIRCAFCQRDVVRGAPAWYSKSRGVYECIPCRNEGRRAEVARGEK